MEKDSIFKALRRLLDPAHFFSLWRRAAACVREKGWSGLWRALHWRLALMTGGETWRFRADIPTLHERRRQRAARFAEMPLVSVCVPLYEPPPAYLRALVQSVRRQSYENWELVLADGSAGAPPRLPKDVRIRYIRLEKNGGIAANTNAAMENARGALIALADQDDVLAPGALYEAVRAVNEEGADFVYSDEVVLDESLKNVAAFHFKPDFSPETLRGCNYITHLSVFRRTLLEAVGGERPEFDGAQDFDLILRLTERAAHVAHVPKVLYWWRAHGGSTAQDIGAKPAAIAAGARAVAAHLARVGLAGTVTPIPCCPGAYHTRYETPDPALVSVLIPNCDHADDLTRCVEALLRSAGGVPLEILIVENNSKEAATFACYDALCAAHPACRVLRYAGPFNFSAINNFAARQARGTYLLLLNNDVEAETPDFVRELVSYAQRPEIGAVGAKLFYPDGSVQHGGLFIGLGGSAGCNHKGYPRDCAGDMYRLATTQNFCAVTGACLLVRRAVYEQFGGLDETDFAVAYNDVDFCLRLWQAGLRNVMTPFAAATHYESKSRGDDTHAGGEKQARYEAERARFRARYASLLERGDPYYNPHLTLLYENYGMA